MIENKKVLLCVSGSIAAYKSPLIVSALKSKGAAVTVAMTETANKFVTALSLEIISENKVYCGFFDAGDDKMPHVNLAKTDLILVAPGTADIIARIANGYASDLPSATILSASCPIVVAPAMNTGMWNNRVFRDNLSTIKNHGITVVQPESGKLACGQSGIGRLASIDKIVRTVEKILAKKDSLKKYKFLVAYGPTVEKIDPMRFISNYSSGLTGYHIVEELTSRGAEVTAISGPTKYNNPRCKNFIKVESANEMYKALNRYFDTTDCLIMAAAVADYYVETTSDNKLKHTEENMHLKLKPTIDIVKTLASKKNNQFVVGFCAETKNLQKEAKKKLKEKHLDMIIANKIGINGTGPGAAINEVYLIDNTNKMLHIKKSPKNIIAEKIIDNLAEKLIEIT